MIPKLRTKGAKMQPVPVVPLFEPQKLQGFQSYPEPASLPPNILSLLQDARISTGILTARSGDAYVSGSFGTLSPRGCYACTQNGTPTMFQALGDGTHCSIWRSTNEGSSWTNISPTSGAYGDTRLTDSATRPVFFTLVQDNAYGQDVNTDVVIIGNGYDAPRIYGYSPGSTIYVMSVQYPGIEQVSNNTQLSSQPCFLEAFPVFTPGVQTYTTTGFVFTVSGVTIAPTAGAVYHTTTADSYIILSASISGGSGTVTCSGFIDPAASGTLHKDSGTGDSSITYSAVTSAPMFSYAPGSGAQATVTLNSSGGIASVAVNAGGSGYTAHTVAYLQGAGGDGGGILQVVLSGGAVSAINVIAAGQYTSVPSVYFLEGCLQLTIPANCKQNSSATVQFGTINSFDGTIAGTVLTVTSAPGGSTIGVGQYVYGTNVAAGTTIVSLGTGTGGTGTYNLNQSSTVASPEGMTSGNGLNMSVGQQFIMIVDQITPYDYNLLYSNLQISIADVGGTSAVCFNPASSVGTEIVLAYPSVAVSNASGAAQAGSGNAMLIAFSMPPTPGTIDLKNIAYVNFEYLAASAIATDLAIYVMANSGDVQGGARYGVCEYQDDSRTIGPGQIITNLPSATPAFASGGINAPGITILEDQRFWYDYLPTSPVPSAADIAAGIDWILLFRQDVGQTYYYYCAKVKCSTYDPPWTAIPGPIVFNRLDAGGNGDAGSAVNFTQPLPYATALTVPIGTGMLNINGRTLICGGSVLWISDYAQPFTFTLAQRFLAPGSPDPLSGTSQTRNGETLQNIIAIGAIPATSAQASGAIQGTGTVYYWTDANMYQIPGFDPTSLNESSLIGTHGSLSPYSIARLRTAVYWLDNQNEICMFSAGITILYGVSIPDMQIHPLSLFRVDDQLAGIPADRIIWACGAVRNNRYYLSYTPSGATLNTRCLVWSDQQGLWESIDTFTAVETSALSDGTMLLPYYSTQGYIRFFYFGNTSAGASYQAEHEIPANMNVVNFNASFRELASQFTRLMEVDTMIVSAADVSGSGFSLTTSRVPNGNAGAAVTGAVSWTANQTGSIVDVAPVGLAANRILLSVYGSIPGTTPIYAVAAKVKPLDDSYVRSG
jgi:hypothetical protein